MLKKNTGVLLLAAITLSGFRPLPSLAAVVGYTDFFTTTINGKHVVRAKCISGFDSPSDFDRYSVITINCRFPAANFDDGGLGLPFGRMDHQGMASTSRWVELKPSDYYFADATHALSGVGGTSMASSWGRLTNAVSASPQVPKPDTGQGLP